MTAGVEMEESQIVASEILEELCEQIVSYGCDKKECSDCNDDDIVEDHSPKKESEKKANRRSYVITDEQNVPFLYSLNSRNRDSLYSVREYDEDLDENENSIKYDSANVTEAVNTSLIQSYEDSRLKIPDDKRRRKFSFNSFFHKKKSEPAEKPAKETKNLLKTKKYASALDVREKPKISRTPSSIKKKISEIQSDATKLLKRSLSFREITKKREKEKLTEMKNKEWARSFQSLVESGTLNERGDLSFVNYDKFNTVNYELPKTDNKNLKRTQSLNVHVSIDVSFSFYERVPFVFAPHLIEIAQQMVFAPGTLFFINSHPFFSLSGFPERPQTLPIERLFHSRPLRFSFK